MENKTFFTKKNIIIASSVAVVLAGALFVFSQGGNLNQLLTGKIILKDNNAQVDVKRTKIPDKMIKGQTYNVEVAMNNTGTKTWDKSYYLKNIGNVFIVSDVSTLQVKTNVAKGQSYTFKIAVIPNSNINFDGFSVYPFNYQMEDLKERQLFGEIVNNKVTIIKENVNINGNIGEPKPIKVPEAPDFVLTPGEYTTPQLVTFLQKTGIDENGKKLIIDIRYTTDNSEPTCKTGMLFIKPIDVSKTTTFKAITCINNIPSAIATGKYTIKKTLALPTFIPVGGTYTEAQKVNFSITSGIMLRYTTDGTEPTCKIGSIYNPREPIMVFSMTTIKAIACDIEHNASDIVTAKYIIVNTNRNEGRNRK